MNRFTFSYPTKVYFGEGSAAQDFRTELRKKGKTVLLAYGGGSVKKNGVYDEVKALVPFPVSWTVKMKKKQKETQDILSYHTQAAGCSDKARAKASGGRQPIEECGRTGL